MKGFLGWLRIRGALVHLSSFALVVVAGRVLPDRAVRVPLRQDAAADAQLLLGCLLAVSLAGGLYPGLPEVEVSCPRPRFPERAAWLTGYTTLVGVLLTLLNLSGSAEVIGIAMRNFLLCAGVTLLAAVVAPRALAWLPAGALVAATWTFGTRDLSAQPRSWAVLFAPLSVANLALAAGAALLGAALWLVKDGRIWPDTDTER